MKKKESLVLNYELNIREFLNFYPDIINVEDFKREHIKVWLNYLKDERKLEPNLLSSKYYSLSLWFDDLHENTKISVNPKIQVDKLFISGTLPVVDSFTLYLLRKVMKDNPRDLAILETLHSSGVRPQELCDMQISHFDKNERQIYIPNGRAIQSRTVFISSYCLESINNYLDTRHDDNPRLFVSQCMTSLSRASIWALLKHYSKVAQLKYNVNPYAFRRTFAILLYKNGAPIDSISMLMGHQLISSTERLIKFSYVDLV